MAQNFELPRFGQQSEDLKKARGLSEVDDYCELFCAHYNFLLITTSIGDISSRRYTLLFEYLERPLNAVVIPISMTVCSPVCRRAVQRQITCPAEPIWISDDVLHRSYQRFLNVSKTAKRYGSFGPGPLESRRRLGKRRMAYASSSASSYTPSSVGGIGTLWAWFSQPDHMKYEWQAPTTRPPAEKPPDLVVGWLSGLSAMLPTPAKGISESATVRMEQSAAGILGVAESSEVAESLAVRFVMVDTQPIDPVADIQNLKLRSFRKSIRIAADTGNMEDALKLCENFALDLMQTVAVEGVGAKVVHKTLSSTISNEICQAFPDSKTSGVCLVAFYQIIWEGMSACKALNTTKVRQDLIHRLLKRLTDLMDLPQARSLSSSILQSLSQSQQLFLRAPITNVVFAWVKTWLKQEAPLPTDQFVEGLIYTTIKSKIERVDHDILHVLSKTSPGNLETETGHASLERLTAMVNSAKLEIIEAIRAIDRLENKLRPYKQSVEGLAQALANITNETRRPHKRQSTPCGVLRSVILSCSKQISTNLESLPQRVKISRLFMNVVVMLPQVHDDLFHEVWRDMVACRDTALLGDNAKKNGRPFALLLLRRWVTRNEIKDPVLVSNAFASIANTKCGKAYVTLLFALHYCGGDLTHPYNLLLTFFMSTGVGSPILLHSIVSDLQDQKIRLQPQPFSRFLDVISQHEPKLARKSLAIYKQWLSITPQKRHLQGPTGLRLEYCPNFVLSLIEDTTIPPDLIWELLGIPLYANLDPSANLRHSRRRELSPEMISLMEQMALKFSAAATRPPRVAMRNVEQCLSHLVAHRVRPIPEGISLAITHSGLTRKLLESEGGVGLERVRWCLDKIKRIEGVEVAMSVDEQVYWHRQAGLKKSLELRAERRRFAMDLRFWNRQ